ncbi:MAG: hypothetical protein ACK5WZ_08955 [Pseudobdellovibrionaceae bacterium]
MLTDNQISSDFALSIISQAPIPEYGGEIRRYMIGRKLEVLGKQMLENEYRRSSKIPDVDSLPLETAIGRNVLLKIKPGRKDIPSKEWLKARLAWGMTSGVNTFSLDSSGCDLNESLHWLDSNTECTR